MSDEFTIKDGGVRAEFDSGMVRDTDEGKPQFHRIAEGPMQVRWMEHLTAGAVKYNDIENGRANWTLAAGPEERERFRQSAYRHFMEWYYLADDEWCLEHPELAELWGGEDHAAAVFFNVNGVEYVRAKLEEKVLTREDIDRLVQPSAYWDGGPEQDETVMQYWARMSGLGKASEQYEAATIEKKMPRIKYDPGPCNDDDCPCGN